MLLGEVDTNKVFFNSKINNKFNIGDSRYSSFSISKSTVSSRYYPAFGVSIPLMRINVLNHNVDFIINALNYNDMKMGIGGFTLYTTEYHVNGNLQISITNNLAISLGKGHTSHHLLDDAIIEEKMTPNNFVKDFYNAYLIYYNQKYKSSIYGGYSYIFHYLVDKNIGAKGNLILGFNINYLSKKHYDLYLASDLKFKEEHDFKSSVNIQTGIAINKKIRFAVNYYNGYSENGQYFGKYINEFFFGTYIDAF
ncbi:MAG: hypothetical protein A2X12_05665 [Bacteroidetes bacterium GWE2_29_8]|nr:MAG: hypothetical protein A2X12_05665 [Bacteroidetes bacterium GWE2_29_8]OFY23756.1 MAG: hypothetical protein A2X02_03545 [Bacteroidetes bacterium GWF2_29_10]